MTTQCCKSIIFYTDNDKEQKKVNDELYQYTKELAETMKESN